MKALSWSSLRLLALVLLKAVEQVNHVNELLKLLHLLLVGRCLGLLRPGLSLHFLSVLLILEAEKITVPC